MTGVYCILNRRDGKRYVGSAAKSLIRRIRSHKYYLRQGNHCNKHLQSAWNLYGGRWFIFCILERCDPKQCIVREQFWIDHYRAFDKRFGYNKSPTAGSPLGVIHSKATREKVSKALKGKKKTRQHARRIREAKQNVSLETRIKMSSYARCRSPEHRKRISEAMKGNRRGEGHICSEKAKKRIGEKARLRWAEWRKTGRVTEIGKKISLGHKERKHG